MSSGDYMITRGMCIFLCSSVCVPLGASGQFCLRHRGDRGYNANRASWPTVQRGTHVNFRAGTHDPEMFLAHLYSP